MTLKNNRAPLLCYFKHCAPSHNHKWIQTRVTVLKCQIWVKIGDFWPRVTSKFHGWPRKTSGHIFYATSSFVHHFTTIREFKLHKQSGNDQFGSKSAIVGPAWPWNLTDDLKKQWDTSSMLPQALCIISQPSVNSNSINSPETPNWGQNWRFLVPRDLEIWRMTLKNNRAPLLCYFNHCASFHNHRWIQTPLTVRKRPIWVEIGDFWSRVTLKFDVWHWKAIGHLF